MLWKLYLSPSRLIILKDCIWDPESLAKTKRETKEPAKGSLRPGWYPWPFKDVEENNTADLFPGPLPTPWGGPAVLLRGAKGHGHPAGDDQCLGEEGSPESSACPEAGQEWGQGHRPAIQ